MEKTPIIVPRLRCERCDHEWVPRIDEPAACPACKSPYWDRPRQKPRAADGPVTA